MSIQQPMATSLEDALNTVSQLTLEQQTMLIEIVQKRLVDARRQKIAADARASIATFHRGELQSQSAASAIAELQQILDAE